MYKINIINSINHTFHKSYVQSIKEKFPSQKKKKKKNQSKQTPSKRMTSPSEKTHVTP